MQRLAVVGLACMLSACQSGPTDLLPDKPEKVADFPATTAEDLSHCVTRAAQSMTSLYVFHLNARADKREFVITATEGSHTTMRPKPPKLELHLMTKGESATVEMEKGAVEDQKLNRDIWSTVERCPSIPQRTPLSKVQAPPASERDKQIQTIKPLTAKVGMNSDTFTLDEGQVVLQWPAKMSAESYEDFKSWLDLVARKAKRAVDKPSSGPDQP